MIIPDYYFFITVQQFEETLKPMFNIKYTKECMSILVLLSPIFHMWEMVLVEWENCNILDKTRNVSTHPPMLIGKSTFSWLPNLKKKTTREFGSRSFHEDNHYP